MKGLKLNFHLWKIEEKKDNINPTQAEKIINMRAELNENGIKKQ